MYFDSIPDFLYPDFKVAGKFKVSKNLFRRVRARDSFNAIYSASTPYTIQSGETPDSIAYSKYGNSEWFWTILVLNNITDIHSMWPKSSDELDRYISDTYGEYENKPRHWETTRVKDSNGNTVIEEGIIVELYQNRPDQNVANYIPKKFVENRRYVSQSAEKGSTTIVLGSAENLAVGDILDIQYLTKIVSIDGNEITIDTPLEFGISDGYTIKFSRYENWSMTYIYNIEKDNQGNISSIVSQLATYQSLRMVTNREYEYELNELKKQIKLPKSQYLTLMEKELSDLMAYETPYKITEEGYRISESPT